MTQIVGVRRRREQPHLVAPSVIKDGLAWHEATYTPIRTWGEPGSKIKYSPAHADISGLSSSFYDLRVIDNPQHEEKVQDLLDRIANLNRELGMLLETCFLTWRKVEHQDCPKVYPGRTKEEAQAMVEDKPRLSEKALVQERQTLAKLNRVFSKEA